MKIYGALSLTTTTIVAILSSCTSMTVRAGDCKPELYIRTEGLDSDYWYEVQSYNGYDDGCSSSYDLEKYTTSESNTLSCSSSSSKCKVRMDVHYEDHCGNNEMKKRTEPDFLCDGIGIDYCDFDITAYELDCGVKYLLVHSDDLLCEAAIDVTTGDYAFGVDGMPYCNDFRTCYEEPAPATGFVGFSTYVNETYDVEWCDPDIGCTETNRLYVLENDTPAGTILELEDVEMILNEEASQVLDNYFVTANGGTAWLSDPVSDSAVADKGQWIYYMPPVGFTGQDTISYSFDDFEDYVSSYTGSTDQSYGLSGGTVTINVAAPPTSSPTNPPTSTDSPTASPSSSPTNFREAIDDVIEVCEGATLDFDVGTNDINPGDKIYFSSSEDETNYWYCGSFTKEGTVVSFTGREDSAGSICLIKYWYNDFQSSVGEITINVVASDNCVEPSIASMPSSSSLCNDNPCEVTSRRRLRGGGDVSRETSEQEYDGVWVCHYDDVTELPISKCIDTAEIENHMSLYSDDTCGSCTTDS